MAFVSAENTVGSLLRSYFDVVTLNPEILNEVASRLPSEDREGMYDFLRQREIPVVSGWPTRETGAPVVTSQLMPSDEVIELQSVNPDDEYHEEGAFQTTYGTFFSESLQLSCYGNNQNEANYLAFVVKFALLVERKRLEVQYGLMTQSISIKDYEPVPSVTDANTPWFMRVMSFRYMVRDQWTVSELPLIAGFTVSPYDDRKE